MRDSESSSAAGRPTELLQAYDLVLQGRERYQRDKTDPAAMAAARDLFARAVALDPGYAAAHAQLGLMDIVEHMNAVARDEGGGDLAGGLAQAREAVRLEPDLALGYQVLSYGLAENGDYQGGLQAAQRAVELQRQRPRQPDGAGQGAGALRQLRRGGHQCGAGAPAAPDGARLLCLRPRADFYPHFL